MAEQLTPQQQKAVFDRGGRLLVSAAAGSGKTKVLVDRLISYVMDPVRPANVDDFLIITYTKAAASELRGKIASKLSERIASMPGNKHLQRQMQRLHLAKISTVHSFCADILREYSYMLDISADFRVADENECIELQSRALQTIVEEAYADADNADFFAFLDSQGFGRDDRRVPEIVLKVYNAAKCHLNPASWLLWCEEVQNQDRITDMSQTVWGKYLIEELHDYLDMQIDAIMRCAQKASQSEFMESQAKLLFETADQLRALRALTKWDDICLNNKIDYGRLVFSKKSTDITLIEQIKSVRDACKVGLERKLSVFSDLSAQILLDTQGTSSATRGLISLVKRFDFVYGQLKSARHVLDFGDLEHKMLDLLLGKSRSGNTKVAEEISDRFVEVMVDEYQDSNAVQDAIFTALTEKHKNCFMVGDVKQSIYQFRLADPSIFIDKYNRYVSADDAEPEQGRKVILSKNFRSSAAVISAVNDVFSVCMSPSVGGLDYGVDEALYEGVPHIPLNEPEVELFTIDSQQAVYRDEALFVADKIAMLLDGKHMVRNGDQLRPIRADDIVILLRSPGSVGWEYQVALAEKGIHCTSGSGADLMEAEEIEVLCSLLKTIHNPLVDIPVVTVLLSRLFGFTADELAKIRSLKLGGSIFSAIGRSTSEKGKQFLDTLDDLRNAAQMCNITQLLSYIFAKTRIDSIYSAMPDGDVRVANLQQFCQIAATYESGSGGSLARFLRYLDSISERGVPTVGDEGVGGAVTIMSIHKSKGLEFPVVFLCGLSRELNMESAQGQVLCDKELGLGLTCVNIEKRIQYPSIAKKAIAAKIRTESISEELRVLYVAMTRARDRLIMTYTVKNLEKNLSSLHLRLPLSDRRLLTSTAHCPGTWICLASYAMPNISWRMQLANVPETAQIAYAENVECTSIGVDKREKLKKYLTFVYPYVDATLTPSKQTATQIKGRRKDQEASENAAKIYKSRKSLRKPSFITEEKRGTDIGTAVHAVMQYINFSACDSLQGVRLEIQRLVDEGFVSQYQADTVIPEQIADFFATDIGRRICTTKTVLREFKFTVLIDPKSDISVPSEDQILLQGVVDCAIIEDDGITIIDFKSDRINENALAFTTEKYRDQVAIYAEALSKIYQRPIKSAVLYFLHLGKFVSIV